MSLQRIAIPERIITHGVLVAGAIIFSFPFLWMLSTSVKTPREMATERLQLAPKTPRPQFRSPYIDTDQYPQPEQPDGVPEKVWAVALPRMEARLGEIVDKWRPQTVGPDDNPPPAPTPPGERRREMIEGILDTLRGRLSDEARGKALAVEKSLRATADKSAILPHDSALMKSLSDEAIAQGAAALLSDVDRLADETMLRQVFEDCYRRLALGQVRVRTKDYVFHALFTGSEWRVAQGPAALVTRIETATPVQEARIEFAPGAETVTFEFEPATTAS